MFLPVNKIEMNERGWQQADFVLVTGDAYIDHPSFGTAIISRVLESFGYKTAILSQPDWRTAESFKVFGKPRLGFLINSGNVDSMVNNFSVFKHRRKGDVYSPGGASGRRPDRAVIVYSNRAREAYKDVPIIIGGLEASLRRLGHYDYWDDKVRRSILMDSRADILIYGMGEKAVIEVAEALDSGIDVSQISWIKGTCVRTGQPDLLEGDIVLPDFNSIKESKREYCRSFAMQYRSNDAVLGRRLIEKYDSHNFVIQNPPQLPLSRQELDDVYGLEYERAYHPMYEAEGGVPAIDEVKYSVTANRGCFGGCAFCAITYHQGREVRSRSKESILREITDFTGENGFKGYVHDIGGPTANFRNPSCSKQLTEGMCPNKDCLFPKPCNKLEADHSEYMEILREARNIKGIKKVFIRSGIRYDYMMADKNNNFLTELCQNHVSGILKVAPEHISPAVLNCMHKPSAEIFDAFSKMYKNENKRLKKNQFMVPYFISSHPGARLEDAVELALYMKKTGFVPDQVQDFYPTPGTLATCMYYTERDPFTGKKVYVAKNLEEKKMQRALLHFNKKENRELVKKALAKINRKELAEVLLK